jgi:hypothetical protein
MISRQTWGVITEYTSSAGEVFTIGDTIELGFPFRNETYDFIEQNAGLSFYALQADAAGSKLIIKK